MQLTTLDWIVIAASLLLAFTPALFLARRAARGTVDFFASGRAAPWWLVGTSMVATTFSTDTPNLVTDIVRRDGVAGNWVWWAFLLTGMLTVFFYARLWRRSGVLTDLEFYEQRYSGPSAKFVRGFRAVYLGLFFNCCIMATVTLAAVKIANIMLGWERDQTLLFCAVVCIMFSAVSGLWGVMATDLIQFCIAMFGVLAAAFFALQHPAVGGLSGLLAQIEPARLSLLPDFGNPQLVLAVLVIPLTVQWWSVWYPGSEPGGGSYVAQRMLAAKDERHALAATLWFNIAHYALRPWPWIIVALCSLLVFPELDDIQRAFPRLDARLLGHDIAYPAMLTLLPAGVLGLLIASLLSAYISTMSTHLNWGASYLVHDLYRRFAVRDRSERHYVWVSRGVTAGLMIAVCGLVPWLDTAKDAFDLLLTLGAGTGLLYLLRWFWWRINAWSEIAAMVSSFAIAAGVFTLNRALLAGHDLGAWHQQLLAAGVLQADPSGGAMVASTASLLVTVFATTGVWVAVTLLTRPAAEATLVAFYRRVRPAGPGWRKIRLLAGVGPAPDSVPQALLGWVLGCLFVYAALFGTGSFLYGHLLTGTICAAVCVLSGWQVARIVNGIWRA
ncbi:MAG: Na+:solute symporter [Phycisphaerales bacterium]|nr:Na+:solute symporter [Phycisphaerales bacterium]